MTSMNICCIEYPPISDCMNDCCVKRDMRRELHRLMNNITFNNGLVTFNGVIENINHRLTVIDSEGTVVIDIRGGVTNMPIPTENHNTRREVQQALNFGGSQVVRRTSSTINAITTYYAENMEFGLYKYVARFSTIQ